MGFPAERRVPRPELREIAGRVAPVAMAGDQLLPVVPGLEELFPRRGLKRGSVVGISGTAPGATSLALTVLSAPSRQGSWTAIVGLPALGALAAADLGIDLTRCAFVPEPGPTWPTVVAVLLDAIDVVAVRAPARTKAADARRLSARARERGAVLVVIGGGWPEGPDVRLTSTAATWTGIGEGHGALAVRHLMVTGSGRGAAARERSIRVALP